MKACKSPTHSNQLVTSGLAIAPTIDFEQFNNYISSLDLSHIKSIYVTNSHNEIKLFYKTIIQNHQPNQVILIVKKVTTSEILELLRQVQALEGQVHLVF